MQGIDLHPGFHKVVFDGLKSFAISTTNPVGKAVVLLYDEMCTKEELTYNSQHVKVEGLEELGEDTMGQYVSNHAGK